jgi:uncharacterized membrane protein HdeD (DUF308 family)
MGATLVTTEEETAQPGGMNWRWTLASGLFTILLAGAALLLPLVEWAPRGGLVGWLLLLAGIWEFIFGWKRGPDAIGKAAMGSGLLTGLAGLLFVANPLSGYFPVANVVVAWLLLRGLWMLYMALRASRDRLASWLALSAAADVLLGFVLLLGLQISALVVTLFGPTPEVIANFALILAASLLVTGIAQVAIAFAQRRHGRRPQAEGTV